MTGDRTPDQRDTSVYGSNLEQGFLYVETCDRRWATKIDNLLRRHGDVIRDYGGYSERYPHYRHALMPRDLFSVKSPRGVEPVDDPRSVQEWLEAQLSPLRAEGPWRGIDLRTEIDWHAGSDAFGFRTTQEWMIGKLIRMAMRFPDHLGLGVGRNAWGQWVVWGEWPIELVSLRPLRRELDPPPTFDQFGNPVKADRSPTGAVPGDERRVG